MTPTVSAIVLFHNEHSAKEALNCIAALKKQELDGTIEIIVVDNHAPDEARRLAQDATASDASITYVRAPANLGYGKGNNLGAKHAQGEFILIVNPDNRLEPNALRLMIEYLNNHKDVGLVGPQLVLPDGSIRDSYRTFPRPTDLIIKRTPLKHLYKKRMSDFLQWNQDPNETRDVDWMCGACILLRRSVWEELGGFDERYFLFLEDCDLCRRVWEKNLRVVYLADAKAHDQEMRLSAGGMFSFFTKRTMRIHTHSAIKYFMKWRTAPLPEIRNGGSTISASVHQS